ncbi:MAG: methylthioribulose 1-phosphate dehydratase [Gammaproteobacteria bacterium]
MATPPTTRLEHCGTAVRALREIGVEFYRRGWSLGTSGNYSVVVAREPLRLLITASGKDKGRLGDADFLIVDETGQTTEGGPARASAETPLHLPIARQPNVGAVLHTHSVCATVLSDARCAEGRVEIAGYEMLKGLAGVTTHETRVGIEIVDNSQDTAALSAWILERIQDRQHPLRHGFLIRGHGLYTWGRDLDEARRHVEILEFLFEVLVRREAYPAPRSTPRPK